MGTRFVQDCITIMRDGLGRTNENDPQASDEVLFRHLNDFVSLNMPNDTKLFESFGTMSFEIDESNPTGVYTMNDLGIDTEFMNLSQEAYISILDPIGNSVSWNRLPIYQDPGEFFAIWGINNEEILISGYPTMMLYYGTELTFRTIPNVPFQVKIFGYKKNANFPSPDVALPFDYWLRYISYGAMVNFARDNRYEASALARIERTFRSERKLQLAHTHNQIKMSRSLPQF